MASIRSMITAGLVDEFWLKISPVAVGQGSSMFAELGAALPLTLRTARTFDSGMIEAVYATSSE
ncbi:dihydrofolate reductase family protein [Microlunatus parietis]|uniref:Riboflavin biosynthesis pyrimidine reductase n=1 Tax=Microlunatus parietis TaxID=682979 RepID=A0A7Y9ICF3_9ACTN|nr:riboflavin biosynthesis pyrimidine reductase [Microlunatus parietis]